MKCPIKLLIWSLVQHNNLNPSLSYNVEKNNFSEYQTTGNKGRVKVLHLRASPFLGSPEKILLGQLKYMDRNLCEYIMGVFNEQTGERNDFIEEMRERGYKTYPLRQHVFHIPPTMVSIISLGRREHIHVICTHDYKSNFIGFLAAIFLRVPVVAVFHGRTTQDRKIHLYEKIDDLLLRYFNAIIAVSHETKKRLIRFGLQGDKVHVIPNAVDLNFPIDSNKYSIRNELLFKESDPLVVFMGRLSKEKGLYVLLDAAVYVLKVLPEVKFVLLGQGTEEEGLGKRSRELGLGGNIHLPGFRNDIYAFLREMNLCVLPSFTEGMPMSILEAFAFKKPVVATRVGGVAEVVEDGISGILVAPGDAKALSQAIIEILSDKKRAIKMGEAGFEYVCTHFSIEKQVERYIKVFRKVASLSP